MVCIFGWVYDNEPSIADFNQAINFRFGLFCSYSHVSWYSDLKEKLRNLNNVWICKYSGGLSAGCQAEVRGAWLPITCYVTSLYCPVWISVWTSTSQMDHFTWSQYSELMINIKLKLAGLSERFLVSNLSLWLSDCNQDKTELLMSHFLGPLRDWNMKQQSNLFPLSLGPSQVSPVKCSGISKWDNYTWLHWRPHNVKYQPFILSLRHVTTHHSDLTGL